MLLIDDYSRMTWVTFLKDKSQALERFKNFRAMVENEIDSRIKCLRSDRGGEFNSHEFNKYCEKHGIIRHLSAARTHQQNGVVERKNKTVQEMPRTMLNEAKLPHRYWKEAVHTAVYILNRAQLRVNHDKTPYELWKGRPASVKYFKIFGSKCFIKRDEDTLSKFETRSDEGIFLGYSTTSKAYKWYNKGLQKIVENVNVIVDEDYSQLLHKDDMYSKAVFHRDASPQKNHVFPRRGCL